MKGFAEFANKRTVHDYHGFTDKINDLVSRLGGETVVIGAVGDGYDVIKATLNKESDKTVIISTGIHGDEIAGPLGLLHWLESTKRDAYDMKIVLLPLNNPAGYDQKTRRNQHNQDLNRDFC